MVGSRRAYLTTLSILYIGFLGLLYTFRDINEDITFNSLHWIQTIILISVRSENSPNCIALLSILYIGFTTTIHRKLKSLVEKGLAKDFQFFTLDSTRLLVVGETRGAEATFNSLHWIPSRATHIARSLLRINSQFFTLDSRRRTSVAVEQRFRELFQFFTLDSLRVALLHVPGDVAFNSLHWIQCPRCKRRELYHRLAFNSLHWIPNKLLEDFARMKRYELSILYIGFRL